MARARVVWLAFACGVIAASGRTALCHASTARRAAGATSAPLDTYSPLGGTPPGQIYDLSGFKLQLPISDGHGGVKEIDASELKTYTSPFFYTGPNKAMVMWAPTNGCRTAHSDYPRSELREEFTWHIGSGGSRALRAAGNGTGAARSGGTHTMAVTTTVLQAPPNRDIVIGQVHGIGVHGHCSVVLEVVWSNGEVKAAMRDSACRMISRSLGSGFDVGDAITYNVQVQGSKLTMSTQKGSMDAVDYSWYRWPVAFKCGSYSQDHGDSSTAGGRVGVTHLQTHHS